jgi:hypothetical protein
VLGRVKGRLRQSRIGQATRPAHKGTRSAAPATAASDADLPKMDRNVVELRRLHVRVDRAEGAGGATRRRFALGTGLYFRPSRAPLAVGDEAAVHGARVIVRAVDSGTRGKPTEIEVLLDRPLEDVGLSLLAWQGGRLRRIALPEIGGSVELPLEPGPTGMF